MLNNKDFYPTPQHIVSRMCHKLDKHKIKSILEPSAGRGDIAKYLRDIFPSYGQKIQVDCVESDPMLISILKDNKFQLVGTDFLEFQSYKRYDCIVMNPPFSDGDKHLLKAIDTMKNGGQIVCLLNYETIRNPYSNIRKELLIKLQELNATVEHIPSAFKDADRKTDVDIALIYIKIPNASNSSILQDLKRDFKAREENQDQECKEVAENDIIKSVITQYKFEIEVGIKLIDEFNAIQPKILKGFLGENSEVEGMLQLKFNEYQGGNVTVNQYIEKIRLKYWAKFFSLKEITGLMTDKLSDEYRAKIEDLKDVEFSLDNILAIRLEISKSMLNSLDSAIVELFDRFTFQHSTEKNGNIHYYNGWKTNKASKINKKIIIPCYGLYDSRFGGSWSIYKATNMLVEIEKVFNYLDGSLTDGEDCRTAMEYLEKYHSISDVDCKYFTVSLKKKGTIHITFNNLDLLAKFNIFGSQKKGWLPPNYGKASYSEMNQEEKEVVDSFQNKSDYEKVMNNKSYYFNTNLNLLDGSRN